MDKRARCPLPIALVLVVLVSVGAYVASYYAMLGGRRIGRAINTDDWHVTPRYRIDSAASERFFWAANQLDRQVRPDLWDSQCFFRKDCGKRSNVRSRFHNATTRVILREIGVVMARPFHLIDLVSQAVAVQRYLAGRSLCGKIAWLATHGTVTPVPSMGASAREVFCFESPEGLRCVFSFEGDHLLFAGDRHWFTVDE